MENALIYLVSDYGQWTPNEGINQRNLKIWVDVADKICFGRTEKFGIGSERMIILEFLSEKKIHSNTDSDSN